MRGELIDKGDEAFRVFHHVRERQLTSDGHSCATPSPTVTGKRAGVPTQTRAFLPEWAACYGCSASCQKGQWAASRYAHPPKNPGRWGAPMSECRQCGVQIGSKDRWCPQCGIKDPRSNVPGGVQALQAGGLVVLMVVGSAWLYLPSSKTPVTVAPASRLSGVPATADDAKPPA